MRNIKKIKCRFKEYTANNKSDRYKLKKKFSVLLVYNIKIERNNESAEKYINRAT